MHCETHPARSGILAISYDLGLVPGRREGKEGGGEGEGGGGEGSDKLAEKENQPSSAEARTEEGL